MLRVEVIQKGLVEALTRLRRAKTTTQDRWKKAAYEFGEFGTAFIQKRYRTGGTTRTRTAVRTNRLRGSYGHREKPTRNGVLLDLGLLKPKAKSEALVYGRIHEFGGTIRPKAGHKFLAIPLPAVKTAAGVARGRPRDFHDTFFLFRRPDSGVLMQRRGGGAVPLFALKRSVRIPARPAIRPTANKMLPKLRARMLDELRQAIVGGR